MKAQGIAKDMGMEEYVLDISELTDSQQLYLKFEGLLSKENYITKILLANAIKMKGLASSMFECLWE